MVVYNAGSALHAFLSNLNTNVFNQAEINPLMISLSVLI
jgi:hypothetical protein